MLKSYLRTITGILTNTFPTETFGSIDYTLRYQILPKKKCLTIERRDVNHLEPSKCRTGAENNHQQICYFNRNKKDKCFNRFLENVCHKIDNELKEFNNDIASTEEQQQQHPENESKQQQR